MVLFWSNFFIIIVATLKSFATFFVCFFHLTFFIASHFHFFAQLIPFDLFPFFLFRLYLQMILPDRFCLFYRSYAKNIFCASHALLLTHRCQFWNFLYHTLIASCVQRYTHYVWVTYVTIYHLIWQPINENLPNV